MGDLEDWEYPGIGEGSLPLSTYQPSDLLLLPDARICCFLHRMQPFDVLVVLS